MKKMVSLLLAAALFAFLVISNPTAEEFGRWYARQCHDEDGGAIGQVKEGFTEYLAQRAERDDYLICSVYTYDGHTTLGIALQFIPVDELSVQAADLRADYAQWLEANTDKSDPNP